MEQIKGKKIDFTTWKRIISLSGDRKLLIFSIFSLVLIQSILTPISPLVMAEIIDNVFSGKSKFSMTSLVLVLFTINMGQTVIHSIQEYCITLFTSHITYSIRTNLHEKLLEQSMDFFTKTKIGEIISRLNSEADDIGNVVFKPLIYTIQVTLSLFSTLIAMFLINWKLSVVIICLIPFLFIPVPIIGKLTYKWTKKLVEHMASFTSYISENLSINGIILTKLFGRKPIAVERFNNFAKDITHLTLKQTKLSLIFDNIFSIGVTMAPLIVFWLGGPKGPFQLSAGIALAFSGYVSSLFNPLQQMGRLGIRLKGVQIHFERFFTYLDMKSEIQMPSNPVKIHSFKGQVELNNVSFQYDSNNVVFKGLNLIIYPKDKVALVGSSGSGKTTIAYLISRLYDPNDGEVKIDGINLKEIDPNSLHSMIGMISQEVFLMHTTIKENILLANPDATIEQIEEAAKRANIHEKIISLPDGYNTIVGERGYKLSGGEKQRIAIARVFLQNPPLLILDEATSSLDVHSEYLVQKSLEELTENRTVIVIAHRPSAIQSCNKIIVLEKGEIVQLGSPEELMNSSGKYASLFNNQSSNRERILS
ncbi:ABC transporter ATP-binding protein/permease [Bacillus wiedmannii]|uniref:ABC transporter ATP-binding protein n=1 Tax=Bacillus wiedmannii TaxID=1890302 RepID=UPI000BF67235|nr:ABC transporter ATP-binding protein [Bacillus wiedmannii]MCU5518408.1 ABC transporter ATP-binding protein/permease [Bacillus wiedmannii]PGD05839.1 hypothetical protein COM34_20960 [Bacillus wiedmannii]PGE25265.1 hypothetical protein COM52_28325 [Bacillus wiedmannii]